MAKAVFHKHQRVYVTPVGTWAQVEQVIPHWTKGLNEPLRINYDVGLGREFAADELVAETAAEFGLDPVSENWRVMRAKNKWQTAEEASHHPFPGTYPIVVTHEKNWGGWRVPAAEYDQDPARIETQGRIMAHGLHLVSIARRLVKHASTNPDDLPSDILAIAKDAKEVLTYCEIEDPDPQAHGGEDQHAPQDAAPPMAEAPLTATQSQG